MPFSLTESDEPTEIDVDGKMVPMSDMEAIMSWGVQKGLIYRLTPRDAQEQALTASSRRLARAVVARDIPGGAEAMALAIVTVLEIFQLRKALHCESVPDRCS